MSNLPSLGLILPTNNPDIAFRNFASTVKYIKELAPYSKLLINYQLPWDRWRIKDFNKEIEKVGIQVYFAQTYGWNKPTPMVAIREVCAQLWSKADIYLLMDDDMEFSPGTPKYPMSSGQRYIQCLDYMKRFPRCGGIICKSSLGGSTQRWKIIPVWDDLFATNKGLFLRNMNTHGYQLSNPAFLNLRGGLEESLFVYDRYSLGYYMSKQMNNPTLHTGPMLSSNLPKDDIHNLDVLKSNAIKYIQETYNMKNWEYINRKFKKGKWKNSTRRKTKNPIDKTSYFSAGGVEINDKLIIDYIPKGMANDNK